MKIHSNIINRRQIRDAAYAVPGVISYVDEAGGRSRRFAYDVALAGDGTPDQHGTARRFRAAHRTLQSTGLNAASYADWGHVLAALFELDPEMIAGPYKGRDDFHAQTKGVFCDKAATCDMEV